MGKLIRKITVIIVLVTFILGMGTYSLAELDPYHMPKKIVRISKAIDFIKLPGDILEVDRDSDEFQLITLLDAAVYSDQVGHLVEMQGEGWSFYVVTGEKARYLEHRLHALAFTDSKHGVVVLFDVPGANRFHILSHEMTHVLQAENGAIGNAPRILMEYQAEIVSRTVWGLLDGKLKKDKLDTKSLSSYEKAVVMRYLAGFAR